MTQETPGRHAVHQEKVVKSAVCLRIIHELSAKRRLGVLAVLIAVLALHLWSLMRFPAPHVDEAWLASRAWGFIHTGRAFGPLDAGVIDRFEGYWTFYPWLPVWIQSLALRLSTEPALLPVRIVSLSWGFLLLVAVYAIGKGLYGKWPGLLAALLVSVSLPFLGSAHLARYDIITAALGFAAIALHLNNHAARAWVSLVAGCCIGLAFEIHPHGVVYVPAVLALYFLHHRWSMFRRRDLWAFAAGVALGFVLYGLLHIARYPRTYLALRQILFAKSITPPILTLDPQVMLQAVYNIGTLFARMELVLIPIIVWAIVALTRRRSEADKTLLALNATLIGGATLLFGQKVDFYAILFTPAVELLVAALLVLNLQRPWHGRIQDYARVILSLGMCIGAVALNLSFLRTDASKEYEEAQGYINQIVQPGESIMASQTYWLGLHDHDYYSWESLIHYQRYAPGSTLEDALQELRPSIFIIDQQLAAFVSDEPGESGYVQHLHLSRIELEAFLSQHAALVGLLEIEYYGPIRVYRIAWDEEEPNR